MYFHGGFGEYILFESWKTQGVWDFVAAAFFAYTLAVAYDAIKFYRNYDPNSASSSLTVTKKKSDSTNTIIHIENSAEFT